MIKRLLKVLGIIAGIALYSLICYWLSFPMSKAWGGEKLTWFVVTFLFFIPIGVIAIAWISYGLAELICWIITGAGLSSLPEKAEPVKEISIKEADDDRDEKLALEKLDKEFPGATKGGYGL